MKTVELRLGNHDNDAWTPIEGEETNQLIAHIGKKWTEAERESLRKSTAHILSQCSPPVGPGGRKTGLVVGYVQSGKTASFTSVAAMAADNGYPLIVVLTGTKNNLQKQSADRLEDDLQLKTRKTRKWRLLREPGKNDGTAIRQILEDYREKDPDGHVALVVLKKHKAVLKKFMVALKGIDLKGVPVIIIDDEADQASLNARVNQDEESPTYAQICELRDKFDNHTFLEYTATPQANLLISVLDVLSPQFAEVIEPGGDYVGGVEFFGGGNAGLVRDIPIGELPVRKGPPGDVPKTLLEAMRLYFLGVAAGYVTGDEGGNRTMFIHPSRETDLHGEFAFWIRQIMSRWVATLEYPPEDIDRVDLLESFEVSYGELRQTVGEELPGWDQLQAQLRKAIRRASVDEVNSVKGSTVIINWKDQYARVIVGGQALDRGVTIEGLTVTYMPRGVGSGAADSLQQRARFLGYKRSYLGYCRLYLDASVKGAFNEYVEHEKSLRKELDKLRDKPVTSWRRVFILSPNLQPTRRNVLSLKHVQATFADQWYWVRAPHVSSDACRANFEVFTNFLRRRPFTNLPETLYGKVATRHKGLFGVPLRDVLDDLLVRVAVPDSEDQILFTGLCFQLGEFLKDHSDAICDVLEMRPLDSGEDSIRSLDKNNQIENIFQGRNRNEDDPLYYPGDRSLRDETRLTVQLRTLTLRQHKTKIVVATEVPVLALWVPEEMRKHWLSQEQQS